MNEIFKTASAKIILNFMAPENKVQFYVSSDGTHCVEWLSFGRWESAPITTLAKNILRHKKNLAKNKVF